MKVNKHLVAVALLACASFFANVGGFPIYILDEAKNAACAMEMAQRDDWVVPTFNGALRTDKPSLHYYFMRAGYGLFGITPVGARFFSALMGVLTTVVVFLFVSRAANLRTAWLASGILICSIHAAVQFHLAVPDPYLIFFMTCGWLAFASARMQGHPWLFGVSYASVALAFMAKGPVAPLLFGLAVLVSLALQGQWKWRVFMSLRLGWGALIFLAIALPWWVAVSAATEGEWVRGFLFDHNLKRFTSTMEGHRGVPGLAVVFFALALLPLSAFLPQALRHAWRLRREPMIAWAFSGVVTTVVFFSFSRTFLPTYVGPAIPLGAILLAAYFDRVIQQREAFSVASLAVVNVIFLVLPIGAFVALRQDATLHEVAARAWLLLPLPLAGLIAWFGVSQRPAHWRVGTLLTGSFVAIQLLFYFVVPALLRHNPVSASAPHLHSGKPVYIYQRANAAFVFEAKRPLPVIDTPAELADVLAKTGTPIVLLTRRSHADTLSSFGFKTVFEKRDLFETPQTVVAENDF
ncbi:MAG: glycosyltransferase family 39 protein [Cyclobacteriaceae bacterium]|jgi:4-amino-4-deoxy-L-arabinose transferase-like glycosyltransferase|nr:glycosyltransferase family 39 protein [Cyclobacteriaceae bacterium]